MLYDTEIDLNDSIKQGNTI